MQKARPGNPVDMEERRAQALTQAALDAAAKLGLPPQDTAAILGVPVGAFTAMKKGERSVDGYSGEAERADALVRMAKKLKALLGDEETHWRAWIRREHERLGTKPLEVMKQRDGVLKIASLLETFGI